jgi:hypothetical protein
MGKQYGLTFLKVYIMVSSKIPKIVVFWAHSIGNATPRDMTSFYFDRAVLLATYEDLLFGKSQIEGYFDSFLDKDNLYCKIIKNITQSNGLEDIASGIYLFSFTENGKNKVVEARYSFVIYDGKILNHHSSETPE